MAEAAIVASIMTVKLCYLIWRKNEILEILNNIGVYSIQDREEFNLVNDKLKKFMKFAFVLIVTVCTGWFFALVVPIFRSDRELFLKIGFPLELKNNEIAFWIATGFIFGAAILSMIAIFISVVIWYLMISCALRYEILGIRIRNMGTSEAILEQPNISDVEKHKIYLEDLTAAIESHQQTRKY